MTRTETDSLGTVEIDADRYWGPQTERARLLFKIGTERFPAGLIRAVGLQKQASAEANQALGELPAGIAGPIAAAAAEIAAGRMDAEFPLPVWQTGSGTQTNMNANEVIANRANESLGHPRGSRDPVHPNDHVNRGQSSNDSFPTMMHVAAAEAVQHRLAPALRALHASLARRAAEWSRVGGQRSSAPAPRKAINPTMSVPCSVSIRPSDAPLTARIRSPWACEPLASRSSSRTRPPTPSRTRPYRSAGVSAALPERVRALFRLAWTSSSRGCLSGRT